MYTRRNAVRKFLASEPEGAWADLQVPWRIADAFCRPAGGTEEEASHVSPATRDAYPRVMSALRITRVRDVSVVGCLYLGHRGLADAEERNPGREHHRRDCPRQKQPCDPGLHPTCGHGQDHEGGLNPV
eukprot:2958702-Rhodomonas_salina.1